MESLSTRTPLSPPKIAARRSESRRASASVRMLMRRSESATIESPAIVMRFCDESAAAALLHAVVTPTAARGGSRMIASPVASGGTMGRSR